MVQSQSQNGLIGLKLFSAKLENVTEICMNLNVLCTSSVNKGEAERVEHLNFLDQIPIFSN